MSATEIAPNVYARAERNALCDLFLQLGPDAPTLCEGWQANDLAAHLIVREGRNILTSSGIQVSALSGLTRKAMDRITAKPWPDVVDQVRSGPPRGSMMRSPKLDGTINTVEYLVHHEDLRRAQPGWTPRDLDAAFSEDLWGRIAQFGKRVARKSPVGIVARHTDGRSVTVKDGPSPVTVVGDPAEILLFLFNRDQVRVELQGDAASITELKKSLVR